MVYRDSRGRFTKAPSLKSKYFSTMPLRVLTSLTTAGVGYAVHTGTDYLWAKWKHWRKPKSNDTALYLFTTPQPKQKTGGHKQKPKPTPTPPRPNPAPYNPDAHDVVPMRPYSEHEPGWDQPEPSAVSTPKLYFVKEQFMEDYNFYMDGLEEGWLAPWWIATHPVPDPQDPKYWTTRPDVGVEATEGPGGIGVAGPNGTWVLAPK
jgi:hypothetical protein